MIDRKSIDIMGTMGRSLEQNPDILKKSLAFKGVSTEVFKQAVERIRIKSANGEDLYPPAHFPMLPDTMPTTGVRNYSERINEGRYSQAEGVAIEVLLKELSVLTQSFGMNFTLSEKLNQVLQLPENGSDGEALDSMSKFGLILSKAAKVRENLLIGWQRPERPKNWEDKMMTDDYDCFAECLRADNLVLGRNTANKIVTLIEEEAREKIPNDLFGYARDEAKIKIRIESAIHGAKLARDLYLEVRENAAYIVEEKIGLKN